MFPAWSMKSSMTCMICSSDCATPAAAKSLRILLSTSLRSGSSVPTARAFEYSSASWLVLPNFAAAHIPSILLRRTTCFQSSGSAIRISPAACLLANFIRNFVTSPVVFGRIDCWTVLDRFTALSSLRLICRTTGRACALVIERAVITAYDTEDKAERRRVGERPEQLTFDFFGCRFRNTGSRQSLQSRHNADCVRINPDIGHPAPRQSDDVDPGRKGAHSVCPRITFQPIHRN